MALNPNVSARPATRLRNVRISGGSSFRSHSDADTLYTPPVPVEAVNATCGGREILVIDASNAAEYNGRALDPSTLCFVSVVGVNDLNIVFAGSADVNGAFMVMRDANISITGLHLNTWGGYGPSTEQGPHGVVAYGHSSLSILDSDINVHTDYAAPFASAGDANVFSTNLRALVDYTSALHAPSPVDVLLRGAAVEANGYSVYSLYNASADVDVSDTNTYICGPLYASTVTCADCNAGGTCTCSGRIVTTEAVDCPCTVSVTMAECLR